MGQTKTVLPLFGTNMVNCTADPWLSLCPLALTQPQPTYTCWTVYPFSRTDSQSECPLFALLSFIFFKVALSIIRLTVSWVGTAFLLNVKCAFIFYGCYLYTFTEFRIFKCVLRFVEFNFHPASLLCFFFQDLKPSNVAVNEDCELRVRLNFRLNLHILHFTLQSELWL